MEMRSALRVPARKHGEFRMLLARSILTVLAAVVASSAWAQQAPMSEDLVWKLLEIGRVVDPAKTAALFAPMQEQEPYQGARPSAKSSTGRPIVICSTSSRRRRRHRPGRC